MISIYLHLLRNTSIAAIVVSAFYDKCALIVKLTVATRIAYSTLFCWLKELLRKFCIIKLIGIHSSFMSLRNLCKQ